jgi:hypothetical protein
MDLIGFIANDYIKLMSYLRWRKDKKIDDAKLINSMPWVTLSPFKIFSMYTWSSIEPLRLTSQVLLFVSIETTACIVNPTGRARLIGGAGSATAGSPWRWRAHEYSTCIQVHKVHLIMLQLVRLASTLYHAWRVPSSRDFLALDAVTACCCATAGLRLLRHSPGMAFPGQSILNLSSVRPWSYPAFPVRPFLDFDAADAGLKT